MDIDDATRNAELQDLVEDARELLLASLLLCISLLVL